MKNEIRVFAPASVSNVACGFDVMGFAINEPGDEIILRLTEKSGVVITKITGDNGKITYDPYQNTAGAPVISMLKYLGMEKQGVEIEIHKKMPLGSGIGSSAASAVAAAFAANIILEANLPRNEVLNFALEGEKIASGAIHADNVAPCLYGGFILIRGYNPIDIIEIPVPENLYCTIIYPHIEIKTKEAREILPIEVKLVDAKTHWGNTAGLIAGLITNDLNLVSRSIQDVIIEPVRAKLIPNYYGIKNAALDAGSLGCNISGSGPSIFALSSSIESANKIGEAMQKEVEKIPLGCNVYVSKINKEGPRVI
ncbi:MAG: homoserine kinase [Ignavibacteriales bacterium]|nr:MAG: homoserine kinase [Ignavibacteriales bacterium]